MACLRIRYRGIVGTMHIQVNVITIQGLHLPMLAPSLGSVNVGRKWHA